MAGSSDLNIQDNMDNYDWMQSSSSDNEQETPQPKRLADEDTMAVHYCGQELAKAASPGQVIQMIPVTKNQSPRKRPEPTEGYVYGFILPFKVDNNEYCVVKIGKTGVGQVGRRLKDHNNEFTKATDGIPIFTESFSATTPDEIIVELVKRQKEKTGIFLLSYVRNGLRAAEFSARTCIGVAPFNTEPVFKTVFPDSKRVTTTEWVVARKRVVEDIKTDFQNNKLDSFDTADALSKKLQALNKRKYVTLTISLDTLATRIYSNKVEVPQYYYASDSRDS